MIGKVVKGAKVGGLLRYLYGPGRANEHIDPHLVAGWDDPADLEPPVTDNARRDLRRLSSLLEQPLATLAHPPAKPVWHCSIRLAPTDRRLNDTEWAEIAREVVDRTGLAPKDDDSGCRWVAVRHADDHIHLVVTLARQDGKPARPSNDFHRLGEACRWAEQRFNLTRTAGRDRTAPKRPTRAENEKAARHGRRESPRVTLRREVKTVAAASAGPSDFLARLSAAGLLVRERRSDRDSSQITGYAVALPGDRTRTNQPVWFGGGKLAADLTLPKLRARWGLAPLEPPGNDRGQRLSGTARDAAWARATQAAAKGADDVRRLAGSDPGAASDAAHATADVLAAAARVIEGRTGGPLTDASDAYDRASRDLWARTPRRTPVGEGLRLAARTLSLTGRASRDETAQAMALMANLAALVEAVAQLRDVQQRAAQAVAARAAAERLRSVAPERHHKVPTRHQIRQHPQRHEGALR